MQNSTPKISIVVPVKDGMATLPNFIAGVQKQTLFEDLEIIVVDSASNDESVSYLSQFSFVKLVSIDPKTFNHGATRNLGVSHTSGEFVVMTVQDATPVDEFWLEAMLGHFNDLEVMGVCGQQVIPHHLNKNPHEWFRPQSKGEITSVQFKDKDAFKALTPKQQRKTCGWDDVNAMYRKEALLKLPFEPLMFGEDMLWAKMALENGFKLIFDHNIRVHHYHFQFPSYTYKRVLISKLFIYKCFGYIDDRAPSIKDYALIIYRNFKWKLPLKWIWHNFQIIKNSRAATKDFLKAIKNNTLTDLEQSLALNIPIGKQSNSN
nr:glycosyltransferase [uncultured Psychroserpens sp.]